MKVFIFFLLSLNAAISCYVGVRAVKRKKPIVDIVFSFLPAVPAVAAVVALIVL